MTVHQLTRLAFINAYLVEEDDGLTVIDTMLGGSAPRILAAAQQLGKPITRIALTHAHGDHIGSLDALHAALPEAEVLISARDARLLVKDLTLDEGEPQAPIRGSLPGATTKPTRPIAHRDRIGSLEVIASPGHTPGHVSFLDTRDGTLYCGDTFTTWGRVVATTANADWRFPLAQMATWHKPTVVESARALRALEPARLAPGHGNVWESPLAAMDAAIARGA